MLRRSAALASILALLATPLAAHEGHGSLFDEVERFLRRMGTQYAVMMLRTVVDITYESMAVDVRSNDVMLSGIRIRPDLEWDRDRDCVVEIDRVRAGDLNTFSHFRSVMQVSGVTIPRACFQPQQGAMLASFGFDGIEVDSMALDLSYDFPTSGAEIAIQAGIRDAGDLTISADFDYLFLHADHAPRAEEPPSDGMPMTTGADMEPIAWLDRLEISFRNDGLFQRVEPLITQQVGDLNALPQMAQGILLEALSEGGSRSPTAEEMEFVESVSGEVARFVSDKDQLVVTVAPEGGVLLTEQVFESPVAALAALEPTVSSQPAARRSLIAPERLAAALGPDPDISDDERLQIGVALVTGKGAPRSLSAGAALLEPLADDWNGEANLALARAREAEGETVEAYRLVLRAMAAAAEGTIGLADELETDLSLEAILDAQADAVTNMPSALRSDEAELLASGNVGAFRSRASDLAAGAGTPRSYAEAYYWATLAAAAGDRVSASLMNRLDSTFSALPAADRSAWNETSAAASERALDAWTAGGVGERMSGGGTQ